MRFICLLLSAATALILCGCDRQIDDPVNMPPLVTTPSSAGGESHHTASPTESSSSSSGESSGTSGGETTRKAYISMKSILQNPELPTGCEVTALTMALHHLGFTVDKSYLADQYLPMAPFGYSPYESFIGHPSSAGSWGCFAPVIVKTANAYLQAQNSPKRAVDLTGISPKELYAYVTDGTPVLCWITINLVDTYVSRSWTAKDTGEEIHWLKNEHCAVLTGYDLDKRTVTMNDPLAGIVQYPMDRFENRFITMGQQAVLLS